MNNTVGQPKVNWILQERRVRHGHEPAFLDFVRWRRQCDLRVALPDLSAALLPFSKFSWHISSPCPSSVQGGPADEIMRSLKG
jgi:hypothetical protein